MCVGTHAMEPVWISLSVSQTVEASNILEAQSKHFLNAFPISAGPNARKLWGWRVRLGDGLRKLVTSQGVGVWLSHVSPPPKSLAG